MSKMGGNLTSDTDPNSVTVLRKGVVSHKTLKTAADLNAAQRRGVEIETSRKVTAGSNKQHSSDKNAARLDEETEQLHHDRVPLAVGRTIQQGRQTKEWSQKDLATHINEKPQIVAEYESGKAVPNQQVLNKMEKALGIHLRGKDMGKPLPTKVVAAAPAQAKKK